MGTATWVVVIVVAREDSGLPCNPRPSLSPLASSTPIALEELELPVEPKAEAEAS